jgi:hypothetical protein
MSCQVDTEVELVKYELTDAPIESGSLTCLR